MDTALPPALDRRTAPRPVPVASGFVQPVGTRDAQWICAMCGRCQREDTLAAARERLDFHLEAQHRGWVLLAGPGREHAIAEREPVDRS